MIYTQFAIAQHVQWQNVVTYLSQHVIYSRER